MTKQRRKRDRKKSIGGKVFNTNCLIIAAPSISSGRGVVATADRAAQRPEISLPYENETLESRSYVWQQAEAKAAGRGSVINAVIKTCNQANESETKAPPTTRRTTATATAK